VATKFQVEFDLQDPTQRRAVEWLMAQPDPAEAAARLIVNGDDAALRLAQCEELATLLVKETRELRVQITGQPIEPKPEPESPEDPESARRLDSMFG